MLSEQQQYEQRVNAAQRRIADREIEPLPVDAALRGLHQTRLTPETLHACVCVDCGGEEKRVRPPRDVFRCKACEVKARVIARAAVLRQQRRECSGVGKRHGKFQKWDDLKGPAPYLKAVSIFRRFCETGDSVLAVLGARGTGKTQALCVATMEGIDGGKDVKVRHVAEMLGDLKRRYDLHGDAESAWIRDWLEPELLIIDEIAELVGGDVMRAALTRLIDRRYTELRPTILAGNLDAAKLSDCVGSSAADRCGEGGRVVLFEGWPSFRAGQAKV